MAMDPPLAQNKSWPGQHYFYQLPCHLWLISARLPHHSTVMKKPSICFHPGVQAVNEWQLDRKTDTDRPDSGASRPLAERQHQLFGVYHLTRVSTRAELCQSLIRALQS